MSSPYRVNPHPAEDGAVLVLRETYYRVRCANCGYHDRLYRSVEAAVAAGTEAPDGGAIERVSVTIERVSVTRPDRYTTGALTPIHTPIEPLGATIERGLLRVVERVREALRNQAAELAGTGKP